MIQEFKKDQISRLLRQVDEAIKKDELDSALQRVYDVYSIDQKNSYAHAFEERILALKAEREALEAKQKADEDARKAAEEMAAKINEAELRRKTEEITEHQRQKELEDKQKQDHERNLEFQARKASLGERKELVSLDASNVELEMSKRLERLEHGITNHMRRALESERRRFEEELEHRLDSILGVMEKRSWGKTTTKDSSTVINELREEFEIQLSKYEEQLNREMRKLVERERKEIEEETFRKMQESVRLTQNEIVARMEYEREDAIKSERAQFKEKSKKVLESQMLVMMEIKLPPQILETLLKSLRIALSIEDSEFREIERRVKVNKFVDAIREAWRSGNPSDEEFNLLKKLQSLYQISDEDNLSITKRVKKEFGLPDETAPILVVDDEEYVLEFISHILRQTYRTVITAKSVEEAEQILSTFTPALILSDVRMPAPGVGGFTFYERIKEGRYGIPLKDVHFILMSAIADDFFVKTAKQLGVQAYLIKPFTREILEDTIKNALLK